VDCCDVVGLSHLIIYKAKNDDFVVRSRLNHERPVRILAVSHSFPICPAYRAMRAHPRVFPTPELKLNLNAAESS
jgi:hypothetical protein